MIKKIVCLLAAFMLKKAAIMRFKENPLHKENIELLIYTSRATKLLRKPPRELTPEEKKEWIKWIDDIMKEDTTN